MMMRFWTAVIVVAVGGVNASGTDHNKDAHNALCDVLKAAVDKWEKRGEDLSETLRKALEKTLFGEGQEEDIKELRQTMPTIYGEVVKQSASRSFACGLVRDEKRDYSSINQVRWSGHSGPHDMVCLCTLGENGWPLDDTRKATTLCGETDETLGCGKDKKGWNGRDTGLEQIKVTWTKVVAKCLKDGGKGENLKYALETFIGSLGGPNPGEHPYKSLGKGNFSSEYACSGKEKTGICVKYYPEDKKAIPWWKELIDALKKEEQKEQKERNVAEKHKQEAQKQRQPQKQDQPQYPPVPRAAALQSAKQGPTDNEQENPENISAPLATLEDTSGTPISLPCPWLLSVFLLI